MAVPVAVAVLDAVKVDAEDCEIEGVIDALGVLV